MKGATAALGEVPFSQALAFQCPYEVLSTHHFYSLAASSEGITDF